MRRTFVAAVGLTVFLTALIAVGSLMLAVRGANLAEANRTAQAFERSVQDLGDELRRTVSDYSYWDEAVEQLGRDAVDLDWGEANIGAYMARDLGVSASIVTTRDGRPVEAFLGGLRGPDARRLAAEPAIAALVGAVRALGGERPAIAGPVRAGGRAYLAAAALVVGNTEAGRGNPASGTRVLVLLRELDADLLAALAVRAGVLSVRAAEGPGATVADLMAEALGSAPPVVELAGLARTGHLAYALEPAFPGRQILLGTGLPLVLALGLLTGLSFAVARGNKALGRKEEDLRGCTVKGTVLSALILVRQ